MIRAQEEIMGRFAVDLELANNDDIARACAGDITPDQVRRLKLPGVVDTGATRLVVPESVAQRLGLRSGGETAVRYADGRTAERAIATSIHLGLAGRSSVFDAVVEPGRDSALIGAIVMESLDLVVDCTHQSLVPRDPDHIISEVE